jgi:hypothetical protein
VFNGRMGEEAIKMFISLIKDTLVKKKKSDCWAMEQGEKFILDISQNQKKTM